MLNHELYQWLWRYWQKRQKCETSSLMLIWVCLSTRNEELTLIVVKSVGQAGRQVTGGRQQGGGGHQRPREVSGGAVSLNVFDALVGGMFDFTLVC